MGTSFGLAALVPVVPYLLLPVGVAIWASVVLTAAVLFTIGAVKSRWTRRSALRSGLEVVVLAAFAGIAGYLFGSVLPGLFGVNAGAT
ncbi:MAG: VIT1/CCC1 transporter family protein [Candidatus Rokubacteria bacterium]|nr:VIT1/CCC1 transporter family protein [Candidatus Rokubacteria bacterium]